MTPHPTCSARRPLPRGRGAKRYRRGLTGRLCALREKLRPQLRMTSHHLRRVGCFGAQFLSRVPGPSRIPHCAAREADHVRLAGGNNILCLLVTRDQTDGHGRDSAFLLHLLGEWCLIAGCERNLLPWIKPTTGHVHVIHAAFFEFLSQDYGFLWRPATVDPVSRGDAHAERLLLRPYSPHRLVHLDREAHAVLK